VHMEPVITFRGVRLAYGQRVALDDVDLALPAGGVVALIGPNGSGKSTMLSAIAGLVAPVAGTVEVAGRPAGHRPTGVAYVLQHTEANRLLPMTAREVVMLGRYGRLGLLGVARAADRRAVEEAMGRLAVADLAGRQVRELSGGQRQRVLVAQGLVQDADVLLLDEPITGLDLPSQQLIVRAISDERQRGRTVLLTTHDLRDAARADLVVLLAGRVVAAGPPQEVLVDHHLHEAYGSQLIAVAGGLVLDDGHVHHDAHVHDGHAPGAHARTPGTDPAATIGP
jgi:ABC-type Mn2+/Zn2+ transport system ATPase subunit